MCIAKRKLFVKGFRYSLLNWTDPPMGSVDAQPLEGGDGAIFKTDVRIGALAGEVIKLLDIRKDISVTSNTRDVKHALSAAISCSMYIIRLVIDADVYPFQA